MDQINEVKARVNKAFRVLMGECQIYRDYLQNEQANSLIKGRAQGLFFALMMLEHCLGEYFDPEAD